MNRREDDKDCDHPRLERRGDRRETSKETELAEIYSAGGRQ